MNALLIGNAPGCNLGYTYITEQPYDAVVVGSLTLSQLLCFSSEPVLSALAEGKPVIIYEPGLPECKGNRALAATLSSRRRELKSWGAVFTDGGQKKLITAQQARKMALAGQAPPPGAVLTPMAKDILGGKL